MVELPSFPTFEWEFLVIDTPKGEDLLLGFDFLNHFNPSIDWSQGMITFNAYHKDCYDPSKLFSNDVSYAKSCAALAGDSRAPSFPSSFHIPSLNLHQSLLSSRDEVFKEIQDVGEDNSVSSLHLFFGNMDLPPSSYHDSLEELWDEEEEPEEIETVMKVVPSVYHQYLDVFSKVKAEKLPPHRACDHHIELEGSLPPSVSPTQVRFHHCSDPSLPTIVETKASNYALGAVLSQVSDSGKHSIAFNGHKRILAELNYEIHDKELLGIVWDLKCGRAFLLSLFLSFEVLTNHSSLHYFMSSKFLTCRQAHWAEFHFSITYRPGRLATLPDALSRWENNSQYRSILQELGKGKSVQDYSPDSSSQILLFKDQVVVPNDPTIQLSILQKHHDSPLAGHAGKEKTPKSVKKDFHWSGMTQFIKDYVSSCQQCSRNKNIHQKKFGLLKPLPIPNGPWICLSMEFITKLPLSNSFDLILVIVDRFSKMAVFIPTMSSITSLDLAHLLIKNIFSKHGLPSSIVSDRGSLFGPIFFSSSIFQEICQLLTIHKLMDRQRG
ncbi:hypothetical protein O181_066503 [Austropuccinia psidii MF-1]|uniref:Integrase catalytic domain-containing protein n=1 Tax=Austropuccinia psidii MF-1 TaxID=1389203 RepID=A0A9Q3ERJ9_9BASI|nr:hypothetical protein [Austropuccinia psidii MF-1]